MQFSMRGMGKKQNYKLFLFFIVGFCLILMSGCDKLVEGKINRSITIDDSRYKIQVADDGSYYVKLPDGRPRVPQLSCEEGRVITQAFFPDGMKDAFAKVKIDDTIYPIRFTKDPKLGFELQYDDRYRFEPKTIDANSFESSNPDVAVVDALGNIKIVGINDKGATITASDGNKREKLKITRTVKAPLSVYMITGQSNGAYYYAEPQNATATKPGTAYHYSEIIGGIRIASMNAPDGNMDRGNIEPGLANELYKKMGEKVLVVNSGVSGQKIETFVPMQGASYQNIDRVWQIVKHKIEDEKFKSKYDVRLRSYIWVQGESDLATDVNMYKNDFLKLHQMLKSQDYGFDYGFIVKVRSRYKNAAIAQEDLIVENEDIAMGTRQTEQFSVAEGTMRKDNIHYSQFGDNVIGEETAKTIARTYFDGVKSTSDDSALVGNSESKKTI